MATNQRDLDLRIAALERRVGALESERSATSAKLSPLASPPRAFADVPATPEASSPQRAEPETASAPPQRNAGLEAVLERKKTAVRQTPAPIESAPAFATPPVERPAGPRSVERPVAPDPLSLERLIGGRWFAAIGAIIVIIGLGLALKLARQAGWLYLSETGRVLGVAAFGVMLIVMGEVALRKLGRAASAGLFGAGVGAMFVAAWGTHGMYDLVPVGVAFGMMAAVCALGIAIALRAQLVSLGVLAVVGGYVTPLIAQAPDASVWGLPIYLLGLTGVGMVLGVWQKRFGAVRIVCWIGTTAVGTLWVFGPGAGVPMIALGFVGAVWALYQLDTTRRVHASGQLGATSRSPTTAGSLMLVGATLITGWASFVGWWLGAQAGLENWMVPAAIGVACALGAIVLTTGLASVRDVPRTDAERYGVLLTALAGSELFAALALGLSGWIETTTWLVSGTMIVLAGRSCRAWGLMGYGLALLGFGVVRALAWEPTFGGLHAGGQEFLGLVLTGWTGLLAVAAVMVTISARAIRTLGASWDVAARLMGAGAVGMLAIGLLHQQMDTRSLSIAWAALAVGVSLFGRVERVLGFERVAPVVLIGAVIAWGVAELSPGWSSTNAALGLHPGLWAAVGLSVVGVIVTRLARVPESAEWEGARAAPWVGAGVLIFASTSLEIARAAAVLLDDPGARAGAISMWWGVFAVGLIVAGVLRRMPPVRWTGLGLMLTAAGKAVVLDLADATPGVRVASFLALGVLMMLVAAGYLRVARRAAIPDAGKDDADAAAVPIG